MKKKVFISVISLALFFCFGTANIYAQSVINDSRLVGTWINDGEVWVFNANGTFTADGEQYRWYSNASKLVILSDYYGYYEVELYVDFFLSSDGRTLILVDDDWDALVLRKR